MSVNVNVSVSVTVTVTASVSVSVRITGLSPGRRSMHECIIVWMNGFENNLTTSSHSQQVHGGYTDVWVYRFVDVLVYGYGCMVWVMLHRYPHIERQPYTRHNR